MVDKDPATDIGWKPLLFVGRTASILGIFCAARLASEMVQLLIFGIAKVEARYLLIVALDVPVAFLWLLSGRKLRKHSPALILAVLAAAIALADSLVSAVTLGPRMVARLMDPPPVSGQGSSPRAWRCTPLRSSWRRSSSPSCFESRIPRLSPHPSRRGRRSGEYSPWRRAGRCWCKGS
jgi:hypothetical protein